ncbi:MAG: response regulator transcription factor [Candidatus Solibacter usitatus]|nr:response regulator transcription factor [Candidatus Solibacter usitatus]
MKKISVYVCETQPIVVEGLKRVLQECTDLELAGESDNAVAALDPITLLQPTLVLLDQNLGSKAIFDLIPRIRSRSSHSQTILWVTNLTEVESFRALQMGARGILKKTLPVSAMVECFRAVGQGNIWIENSISNQVVGFLNRRNLPRLTPREQEIVALICRGMKNRQIAETLTITTGTVKVHLMHIFEKTGVKDRFELAMEAHKLVGLDQSEEAESLSAI